MLKINDCFGHLYSEYKVLEVEEYIYVLIKKDDDKSFPVSKITIDEYIKSGNYKIIKSKFSEHRERLLNN